MNVGAGGGAAAPVAAAPAGGAAPAAEEKKEEKKEEPKEESDDDMGFSLFDQACSISLILVLLVYHQYGDTSNMPSRSMVVKLVFVFGENNLS